MGSAYLTTSRFDEGLAVIDGAEQRASAWGERYTAPELPRIRGEIILAASPDHIDEAQDCFTTALALARDAGLRSFELRAATSLARALLLQGGADDAESVLAPTLAWFTEGYDTADHRCARELLSTIRHGPGRAARRGARSR